MSSGGKNETGKRGEMQDKKEGGKGERKEKIKSKRVRNCNIGMN
jgi:hypothetical protein